MCCALCCALCWDDDKAGCSLSSKAGSCVSPTHKGLAGVRQLCLCLCCLPGSSGPLAPRWRRTTHARTHVALLCEGAKGFVWPHTVSQLASVLTFNFACGCFCWLRPPHCGCAHAAEAAHRHLQLRVRCVFCRDTRSLPLLFALAHAAAATFVGKHAWPKYPTTTTF